VKRPNSSHSAFSNLGRVSLLGVSLMLAPIAGCAGAGQFVWYSELPTTERGDVGGDYVIGVGDAIGIKVYEQEGLSGDVKIRSDGKIALPLAGELVAAGKRPLELSREIEARLKEFIVTPRVTVNVNEAHPITVTVVGEVGSVGILTMDPPARIVDALAKSGGLNEYADSSKIFVLRQFPTFKRIRFRWAELVRNEGGSATFPLRNGDVIVVD
jgi:polysaccharide export outer membrane protein